MIVELPPADHEKVRPIFAGLKNRVAISAIIDGHAPGRIFVDDPTNPTAAFTWNEFRYGYLAGDSDNAAFVASLRRLLDEELLPQAQQSHDPTLALYPHPAEPWQERIGPLIGHRSPLKLMRRTFTFDPARFAGHGWEGRVPADLHLQPIDRALLARHGPGLVAEGVLWRSTGDFLSKGAGFCLLKGEEIVSTCFSAFAAGAKYEIGVSTHPDYRRQGFATLTASAFIAHCLQRGIEPVWECWADNIPSVRLAETLGFKPETDHPVYLIVL